MTAAEIQAKIDALEERLSTFAGVTSTSFSDQRTDFNVEQAHSELARLRALLTAATATNASTTRYAATSKGL